MLAEQPRRREQLAVLATLAALTVVAWVLTLSQMGSMSAMDRPMANSSPAPRDAMVGGQLSAGDMGMDDDAGSVEPGFRLLIFLGMWLTMMAAMMLPAATPMILIFGAVYRHKRQRGDAFIPTWVFVAGYLLVWTAVGAYAWGLGEIGDDVARAVPALGALSPRLAAAAMLAAGAYQLTPLKDQCLSHCRSPISFVMHHWRPGIGGALRMGAEHGLYCVGCCWVLFLLLVVVGLSSLPWMGLITLIVLGEKLFPRGRLVTVTVAVALLGLGLLTLARPELLAMEVA